MSTLWTFRTGARPLRRRSSALAAGPGLRDARFMDVRPDAGPPDGATVRLSAAEVRALFISWAW